MEKLGINSGVLLTQIINFLIMMGVLTFLLYKPILKTLDERKKRIEEGLKLTDEAKEEKERLDQLKKRILKEAKEEGQRIVKESIADAKRKKDLVFLDGKKSLDEEKKKMLAEVEREKEKTLMLVRKKAADFAVQISEQILGRLLSNKDQKEIIEQALRKLKSA